MTGSVTLVSAVLATIVIVFSCELVWVVALAEETSVAWLAITTSDCFGDGVGTVLRTP